MHVSALSLFSRLLDNADCAITYVRLRILDWICGSEPPTAADLQREAENQRLQKAFPKIDIDGTRSRG
jgi:hypothetical protein